MQDSVDAFRRIAPEVDYWSLRVTDEHEEDITVRQGVLQPLRTGYSRGAFISVVEGTGFGYAATSDLSSAGLADAAGLRGHELVQKHPGLTVKPQDVVDREVGDIQVSIRTEDQVMRVKQPARPRIDEGADQSAGLAVKLGHSIQCDGRGHQ